MKDVIAAARILAGLTKEQRDLALAFADELAGNKGHKSYTAGKRRGRPKGSRNKPKEESVAGDADSDLPGEEEQEA